MVWYLWFGGQSIIGSPDTDISGGVVSCNCVSSDTTLLLRSRSGPARFSTVAMLVTVLTKGSVTTEIDIWILWSFLLYASRAFNPTSLIS